MGQILSTFPSSLGVALPSRIHKFLVSFRILNFDIPFIAPMTCILGSRWTYHHDLLFMVLLPPFVAALGFVAYLVHRACAANRERIRTVYLSAFYMLVFVAFPSASITVFRFWQCKDFDGIGS